MGTEQSVLQRPERGSMGAANNLLDRAPSKLFRLPLRPIKGWLVASQFVNKAMEAGTEKLWSQMHARQDAERASENADS